MHHRLLAAVVVLPSLAFAQANVTPGLDGKLYDIGTPTVWGRVGAAFPGGRVGFSASNTMCNPGTVALPWQGAMLEDHPKFAFLVARLAGDRIEQISDRSFVKHAFLSLNNAGGPCGVCSNSTVSNQMFPGCSDVYGAGNNGDRFWLGPADEIDPWLGTWNHVGSYFDRGEPDVGAPANHDGIRSLNTALAFDVVQNRVVLQEQDLQSQGASYWYQIHLIHRGEAVANRADNILTRGVAFAWSGTAWSATNTGAVLAGSVLNRWPGALVNLGGNGQDDGRFAVAVKVTGPTNGRWHYEYAVHDVDNARGAAAFSVPVCASARVFATGFRDIDGNALNQWTANVGNGAITWSAPAGNSLDWNTIYNFWFDADAAPQSGNVTLDEARIGLGALQVAVASQVPGFVPAQWLGAGCGAPACDLSANGPAPIPAPGFALRVAGAPTALTALFFSWQPIGAPLGLPLGNGCTQFLDPTQMAVTPLLLSDATGVLTFPASIPSTLQPAPIWFQALQHVPGGAFLDSFNLSNGLKVRLGATSGCQ